jgi:hypothetical protein
MQLRPDSPDTASKSNTDLAVVLARNSTDSIFVAIFFNSVNMFSGLNYILGSSKTNREIEIRTVTAYSTNRSQMFSAENVSLRETQTM